MEPESSIVVKNVMRRVRFIHFGRKFFEPRVFKLGLLFLFVVLQSYLVSIPNVVSNLTNSARSFETLYGFLVAAFANTGLVVQALSVAMVVVAALFVRDLTRKSSRIALGARA